VLDVRARPGDVVTLDMSPAAFKDIVVEPSVNRGLITLSGLRSSCGAALSEGGFRPKRGDSDRSVISTGSSNRTQFSSVVFGPLGLLETPPLSEAGQQARRHDPAEDIGRVETGRYRAVVSTSVDGLRRRIIGCFGLPDIDDGG
jgi:hypothetical protein